MSYEALKEQAAELEKQLKEARKEKKREVVKQVRALCKEFNISAGNLRGALYEPDKK